MLSMTLIRYIESLLTRDSMEYPERRKLEDVPSVKSDHAARRRWMQGEAIFATYTIRGMH
jgi:hypothetical protein